MPDEWINSYARFALDRIGVAIPEIARTFHPNRSEATSRNNLCQAREMLAAAVTALNDAISLIP